MKTSNVSIGLFVIGGLLLFGVGMFLIGDQQQLFTHHSEYYSDFINLAGLTKGAKVRVAGMDAGAVVSIGVPDSPSAGFRVKWRIDSKLGGLVRTDSVATISTEGVVGGTFLAVRAGTPQALPAAVLATIPSKEPTEIADMLVRGNTLLADADGMLKEVGGKVSGALDTVNTTVSNVNDVVAGLKEGHGTAGMLLSDDKLAAQLRESVTTTTSDVEDIIAGVKAGRGAAGLLLRDEGVASQIRESVKNAQRASADLGHASQQADALVSDLNSQRIPQKANDLVVSLNDSARQVNQVVSDLARPDQNGMTAGVNIRESLTNANTATANLAEDSEALKHNFFLRGFFKSRGYYNLENISPDEYRRNHAFTDRANRRVWLSGSELFESGPNGERLSEKGKSILNAALTENGDLVVADPIVVEGYWTGQAPSDQLRLSRGRALLVRDYLQIHFHLNVRNLGFVALKDSTPKGTDRPKWDGVCIVVLKRV